MSITIGTVNKDGTGTTLAIKIPMHAYHTAATTTSSHTGCRWGFFKATDFTYNQITGNVTGPGGGSRFAYYNWLSGDQIELEHPDVNGGLPQLVTILSKINNNAVAVSTAYHGSSLTSLTAYVGLEPLGDLVYKWDCVGASTYTNTDPDPTGLRSSTIDPTRWYGVPKVCHHYETAGTYSIVLTVNDYANSESASKTITVTATDFTSATQFYISNSGNDTTGDGTITLPWRTWAKGLNQTNGLFAAAGGANGRILNVERGFTDTMTADFDLTANRTGPYLIRPYGSGATPIIGTATFNGLDSVGFTNADLRIVDIDFTKTGGSNTGIINGVHHDDSIFLRCGFTTAGADAYAIRGTGSESCARCSFVDCTWTNDGTAAFAVFWEGATTQATMAGRNIIACNVRGSTGSMVRMFAYRSLFAYNDFNKTADTGGGGPAVRFDGSTDVVTGESVLWRNELQNTADNAVGELFVIVTQASANRIDKVILDGNYWDGGAQGVTNIIKADNSAHDCVVRNNNVRARTACTRFMSIETTTYRRWRVYGNSWFGDAGTLAGFRFGKFTDDGGIDDLSFLNNVVSMIGTGLTAYNTGTGAGDYGFANVGNSANPDNGSTFIDYNIFHITDVSPPLFVVRTWTTAASSTAATYTDGAGVIRTLTEVGAWAGYTHASGSRAQPTGVVPQNANNTLRLIGSKTSNDTIVIGGGAGAGWGQDYASVPCNAQTKGDTTVAQLSNWTAIKAAETHNLGGVGASATDPLFIDPATGNLQLQATSPARSVGLALPFNRFDYRGAERYTGSGETADMGAIAYATTGMMVAGRGRGRGRRRGNTWP